jgi:hypothetical protein
MASTIVYIQAPSSYAAFMEPSSASPPNTTETKPRKRAQRVQLACLPCRQGKLRCKWQCVKAPTLPMTFTNHSVLPFHRQSRAACLRPGKTLLVPYILACSDNTSESVLNGSGSHHACIRRKAYVTMPQGKKRRRCERRLIASSSL